MCVVLILATPVALLGRIIACPAFGTAELSEFIYNLDPSIARLIFIFCSSEMRVS